jgi:matrixin
MHLTATNGGQPLSGVSVTAGTFSAVTDGSGAAMYQALPATKVGLSLSGAGIVPRTLIVGATTSRDVAIDAISTTGFDLAFYRQLVRNTFDQPGVMQPLRRWTQPPLIYMKTVEEGGRAIDPRSLDIAAGIIINSTSAWTGGRFGVAGLEQGTADRIGVAGWLTVRWSARPADAPPNRCGLADIAVSGGRIDLYTDLNCRCGGSLTAPSIIAHELGHAMGFWHTDSPNDIMTPTQTRCTSEPSARERAAAAIAYARPIGNIDPDVDPASAVTLAPMVAR